MNSYVGFILKNLNSIFIFWIGQLCFSLDIFIKGFNFDKNLNLNGGMIKIGNLILRTMVLENFNNSQYCEQL